MAAILSDRRRQFTLAALIIVISLVVSVLAAEAFLWAAEFARTTRDDTGQINTSVIRSGDLFQYHPRWGWTHKPSYRVSYKTPEFDVEYRTNAKGLRGDDDYPYQRIEGKLRIIAVGDSFTFGHGVGNAETYPTVLEESLTNAEVLNLGMSGSGTDQQLLMLKDEGVKYHPHVIILGLYKGDIFRNVNHRHGDRAKPYFTLNDAGLLLLNNIPVPEKLAKRQEQNFIERIVNSSKLWKLIRKNAGQLLQHLGYSPAWHIAELIIDEMARVAEKVGAQFVVVIIPSHGGLYGNSLTKTIQSLTIENIQELVSRLDVPYLNAYPQLKDHIARVPDELLYYQKDGHMTPKGNRVLAQIIRDFLCGTEQAAPESRKDAQAEPAIIDSQHCSQPQH